jgi:asparagine synthase (glutamine-hydrolysing)
MMPLQVKDVLKTEIYTKISTDLSGYYASESKNYSGYFEYDMKYSLSSHHVFRDDLSAMKYGVEFRYPYLSNKLIDYVAALPEEIRFNGIRNKPLLRKTAEKYLPSEVLNMPKRGFSFPVHYFLKKKKSPGFHYRNIESLKQRNFFRAEVIDEWWNHQSMNMTGSKSGSWSLLNYGIRNILKNKEAV